ncbi:MAG: glycosyltransferase [Candidatus Binatia bacterium]|nr:glycosyltransferase [Candidatus Binatia bacterium]
MISLASLAAISFVAWVYLAFAHGRFWCGDQRLEGGERAPAKWPDVIAIVPARNESAVIERSLRSLLQQDYPGQFSVILVDDESSDDTAGVARACASTVVSDVPLQILSTSPRPTGWVGKMWALETGVSAAGRPASERQASWFLLTDADIEHSPGNLRRLVARGESQKLSLVSLMVRLEAEQGWGRLLIPAFVYFFQKLYPFPKVNDPADSVAAAAGGCMLVRQAALEAAGGVSPLRSEIIDDCAFGRALKAQGPIWLGLTESERSIRPYVGLREVWDMVARSAFTQLNYSWGLLAGTLLGLSLLYLVPPLALVAGVLAGDGVWALWGLGAWLLMAATFLPTLVLYGRSAWLSLALPLAGVLYASMTFDSAWRHFRGRGAYWKGRAGAGSDTVTG